MKKRSRKDDLFFLSPFLSVSFASFPPSTLPQPVDLSSLPWSDPYENLHIGLRGHTNAEVHTCIWSTLVMEEVRQREKDLTDHSRPIGIFSSLLIQYHDQFNLPTNSLQSLSSTNPPHFNTVIQPWPTKPNQTSRANRPSHAQSG